MLRFASFLSIIILLTACAPKNGSVETFPVTVAATPTASAPTVAPAVTEAPTTVPTATESGPKIRGEK